MRPNVLVVVLDAARRDSLEPYGAAAGNSPAIAQLARHGSAHPGVYATACWTVPSHASIFTGLMPRAAGLGQVLSPAEAKPLTAAHRDRALAEVLRRAGYRTLAASTNVWVSEASGFDVGFDDFEQIDSRRHSRIQWEGRRQRLEWLVHGARGHRDDGARDVEAALRRSLAPGPKPFFCFVNLIECHSPYLPPRPCGGFSLLERVRAADEARRYYRLDAIWRVNAGAARVPDPVLERARRMYAASIRYMDDWLARVLEQLDSSGTLDDTLVIVTSDHGENLGEGGLIAHALSLDNRLIHVPYVAAGPGSEAELSSLASLPRFVAEAAGIRDHPYTDEPEPGCGVAQFDPPVRAEDSKAVEKVRQAGLEHALGLFSTPLSCAVRDRLKVVRRGDREEVYDLSSDPLEQRPVAADTVPPVALATLRAALDQPAMSARWSGDIAAPAAGGEASAEELRELEERMKLLGYM